MNALLAKTDIEGLKLLRRGKVRDVYAVGQDKLLLVATDRLSAFDHILPTPVPGKGEILTRISAFWFAKTADIAPNHMISADLGEIRGELPRDVRLDGSFDGRTMLAWKARRLDVECVVRGYLAGSGWKEYQSSRTICGQKLPEGLLDASKLPTPIFTPAAKNDNGHDENICLSDFTKVVGGDEVAAEAQRLSLKLYAYAAELLSSKQLLLADTKFEFGLRGGKLIVIDELLTPDSSRVWEAGSWKPGTTPASFDKQFVRDYLERSGWDKASIPPALPQDVVDGTIRRYREFLGKVTA